MGHFRPHWAPSEPSGPNFHMREWWPMVLNHNRNRFRPFPAKSNDSNWIDSRKNVIFAIFTFLALLGPISEFCQMYECSPVLDHFQPNQMTQIGLGVQKVCFGNFFRFLLSVRVKKEPKKLEKFSTFFLLRMTK